MYDTVLHRNPGESEFHQAVLEVFYSLGAVVYGARWPGRSARWYGYHEHFHTATIIAAVVHLVAVWMVVVQGG